MESPTVFPDPKNKDHAHFNASCVSLDETDPKMGLSFEQRMNQSCLSWRPTGISLIAQHP